MGGFFVQLSSQGEEWGGFISLAVALLISLGFALQHLFARSELTATARRVTVEVKELPMSLGVHVLIENRGDETVTNVTIDDLRAVDGSTDDWMWRKSPATQTVARWSSIAAGCGTRTVLEFVNGAGATQVLPCAFIECRVSLNDHSGNFWRVRNTGAPQLIR